MSFIYALLAGMVMALISWVIALLLGALGHPVDPHGTLASAMMMVVLITVAVAAIVLHLDLKLMNKRHQSLGGHHG